LSALPQATVLPNDDEKVCKTPVEWLDFSLWSSFGKEHVALTLCYKPSDVYDAHEGKTFGDLDIVVIDCILPRTVRLHKVRRGKVAKRVDAPVKVYKYILAANAIDSTSIVDGKIEVQGAGLAQDDVEHGGDDKALLLIPGFPRNPDLQSRDTGDVIEPFSIQSARLQFTDPNMDPNRTLSSF
jgi:hypothetical protein